MTYNADNYPFQPTALIADDEPLLISALENELTKVWPELKIKTRVGSGKDAVDSLLTGNHTIAFLDIRMPGMTGIDVAQTVFEEWPEEQTGKSALPLFVFVTAHREFALDAIDLEATDYVLKPVTEARLKQTTDRLKRRLNNRDTPPTIDQLSSQIRLLLETTFSDDRAGEKKLQIIKASLGNSVQLVPINDVIMFEASDKYVIVHTATSQLLIRTSLRELLPQLDADNFYQIHRSAIVNIHYVESAVKEENGKTHLNLRSIDLQPVVSRLYKSLFSAM